MSESFERVVETFFVTGAAGRRFAAERYETAIVSDSIDGRKEMQGLGGHRLATGENLEVQANGTFLNRHTGETLRRV